MSFKTAILFCLILVVLTTSKEAFGQVKLGAFGETGLSFHSLHQTMGTDLAFKQHHHLLKVGWDKVASWREERNIGVGYQYLYQFENNLTVDAGVYVRFGELATAYVDMDQSVLTCFSDYLTEVSLGIGYTYTIPKKSRYKLTTYFKVGYISGRPITLKITQTKSLHCDEPYKLILPQIGLRYAIIINPSKTKIELPTPTYRGFLAIGPICLNQLLAHTQRQRPLVSCYCNCPG